MALEDDILEAVEERLRAKREVTYFVGRLQSVSPVLVIMDGTSVPLPCLAAEHVTLVADTRVLVNKYGAQYVVMGVLPA